jgi:hypothetical protein
VKIEAMCGLSDLPNFEPSEQLSIGFEKLGGTFFGFG